MIIENKIKDYNKINYSSGPITFNDYIINKYNKIHNELYEDALYSYIIDKNNFEEFNKEDINKKEGQEKYNDVINNYKFIEIKNEEYYKPSYLIHIKTTFDSYSYTQIINSNIDLTPYWNNYQKDIKENNKYDKLNINKETLRTAKIVYINYMTGKIKMQSRYNDEEFEIDFSTYNKTLELDESLQLKDTFTKLRENNNGIK